MKKYRLLSLLLAMLMVMALFTGCGKKEEVIPEAPEIVIDLPHPEPAPEPKIVNPLTGEETETDLSMMRPYAIMLNNLSAALPQHGNSQADIIYEVLAESGITRMLGVFQDVSDVGNIGSIRSARHYYIELAQGHDAVYIHAGGSPQAYNLLYSGVIDYVDGVNGSLGSVVFYRDKGRQSSGYAYEHTLFTSGSLLTEHVSTLDSIRHEHEEGFTYPQTFAEDGTPNGEAATFIKATFKGGKKTSFAYDAASGKYLVSEYGNKYMDGNTGQQVGTTNVLILFTDVNNIAGDNKGRINVRTTGEGEGWFACGGKHVPIQWSRETVSDPFTYTLTDGTPLSLGVGNSYVCVMPIGSEVEILGEIMVN